MKPDPFALLRSIPVMRRVLSATLIILSVVIALAAAGVRLGPIGYLETDEEDGDKPDHPGEAINFRLLQMRDEKNQIPADGLLKAKAQVDRMLAAQAEKAARAGHPEGMEVARLIPSDWKWLGPGNVGGRIRAIAVHPTDPNKVWVGSVSGGIWRSTNAGDVWQPVNDFMANLAVSSLVINPANPDTMYAGTGELATIIGSVFSDGLRGLGIFKSTDGGLTWNQLPSTNPADAAICADAGTNCAWSFVNRLAISSDGSAMLAATGRGVLRSVDGGFSWTNGGTLDAFSDVEIDPNNQQQAIAGANGFARYSTDGGQTWTPARFTPGLGAAGRVELTYAPSASGTVYASVNINNGEVYRSTDGGANFSRINTGTNYLSQGDYANALWVDPQDANTIVVGGLDLWRSNDAATANPITFTQISQWACAPHFNGGCSGISAHADHHLMVAAAGFNNTTNKSVYFGNDGGLFRADNVLTVSPVSGWTDLNRQLGITQFYSGAAGPTGTLIGGAQDNSTLKNSPLPSPSPGSYDPQGWTSPVGAGGDGGAVAADPSDANYLYTEYVYLALARSSNGGATVTPIYCNPANIAADGTCSSPTGIADAANGANFVGPFVLDPSNANRMLAGGLSLWRSNDVKSATVPTWTAIKSHVQDGLMPPSDVPISAIAVAGNSSDFVVVGHNDGQIYRTSNSAAAAPTWTRIDTASVPNRFVTRLAIDATKSPYWIYATFGGFSPDNVYVTKDLGTTWVDITGSGTTGLPDVPVRSLVFNPVTPNLLYVGTEVGIFASEDAGATWQLPQGGPANVSVDELFFSNGFLTAATYGRGFYTTNNPTFIPGAGVGGGGGGNCVFSAPCDPSYHCTPGDWDCPCTWGGGRVPAVQDDVSVTCANIPSGTRSVRNLAVNGRLSMGVGSSINVAGTLANYDTISGGSISTTHLINTGTISTGLVRAQGGDLSNTGTIESSATWGSNDTQYPIQANDITLGEHGSLIAQGVLCNGNLVIGAGASLHALSATTLTPVKRAFFLNGNATNLGLLDVRGEMAFLPESQTFSGNHTFSGTGQWQLGALAIGDRFNPNSGGRVNLLLASDITLEVAGLSGYGNSSLVLTSDSNVLLSGHNLTINSPNLLSYGHWDVGAGALDLNIPYIKTQRIIPGRIDGLSGFTGTGSLNLTTPGATHLDLDTFIFTPAFHLAAGTVDGTMGTTFKGLVTIDAGAILNVNQGSIAMEGDLLVNGGIGKTSPTGGGGMSFFGSTVTNNGSIAGSFVNFNYGANAVPKTQTITGPGSWSVATTVKIGFPTTAPTTVVLANDMTLNWSNLAIWSDSKITTGAFTLTMPCGSTFDTSSTLYSGEIIGNVRRTNLGDCGGTAVPFTSRYTTVRFDSGTPPSEMTISNALTAPIGFPSAVLRKYQITPVGGSGYSATLRLDYSPADTNGNPTGSLSLWRNNGTNWISQGATARDLSAHWVELSGVTQFSPWALASCALSISPGSTSVAAGGGMGSFQVTSTGTCGWTATSNTTWFTITSGASGSSNGTVSFTADANTGAQRSGTITVNGAAGATETFSVSQGASCTGLTISPTSANVIAFGTSGSIAVTATAGCGWASTSNVPWVTVTSGATGSGNGTVGYNVQTNSGPARSGTISISGQTFTINQASGCYYFFAASEQGVAAAGGSFSTEINTLGSCPWDVVSNDSWITITPPASGTGPGTLGYSVAANPGPPRVGTFSMGDQTFTVNQGSSTPLSLVVTNTNNSGAGSFRQVLLDANANFGQTTTISFNLTGGVTIAALQGLPEINSPVVINGINQDGRRVVLTGSGGGGGVVNGDSAYYGLVLKGGDSKIRGLSIVRFPGSAISLSSARNTIENCYLGTDLAGTTGLGNGGGIEIYFSDNCIGGTAPGTGNTIAFNAFSGVVVATGVNNAIRGNSIFSNSGGLGIDLGFDGVTPNGSGSSGPNNLQRFPVLSTLPGADKIDGVLDAAPSSPFTIELFANDLCNPSGHGEGRALFATINLVTDANGHASLSSALPSFVTTGNSITATATDAAGNTSEFSSCVQVTPLRIQSITRPGSGGMQLKGIGVPNQQHTVEILSNLSGNGVPITVNILADAEGKWQYTDSQSGLSSTRFYRLRFP